MDRDMAVRGAQNHRFPALDGLRGLAALLVILHHLGPGVISSDHWWAAPFNWLVSIGWVGVDLFFVLSGFLITGILVVTQNADNYFSVFYVHRALRIFPILFILLFGATCVLPLISPSTYKTYIGPGAVWPYWAFLSNLRFFDQYFGMANTSILGVTWTLAIEEQFYICWSVAARYLEKARLIVLAAALFIGSVLLRNILLDVLPTDYPGKLGSIFLFTFSHLDGLFIGAIVRLLYESPQWRSQLLFFSKTAPFWACCIGLGLYADFLFGPPDVKNWAKESSMRFGFALYALLFAALMMQGIFEKGWVRTLFDQPWLRRLGTYSYCMYLFHFVVARFATWALPEIGINLHPFGLFCVQLAGVIGFAHLSYVFVERPILNLKSCFRYSQDSRLVN
jgi:peptidoglycan/LPS O-acetylase OafA/YrhL